MSRPEIEHYPTASPNTDALPQARAELEEAFASLLAAQSWRDATLRRDIVVASLRAYIAAMKEASRAAGRQSHAAQARYGVYDIRVVRTIMTVSGPEDTELWNEPSGDVVHGWQAVSGVIHAALARHDLTVDQLWLADRMLWRRNTVIRDGEATIGLRLPVLETQRSELWLGAVIVHEPEETES